MESRRKKKSIFTVGGIFNTISSETESDNAFRMAMFNGIAGVVVLMVIITTCGIYFILQPFFKPLLWALVCGSVLHPFKLAIAERVRTKIIKLESDSKPLYLSVLCLPLSLILKASDSLGNFLIAYRILLFRTIGCLCSFLLIYFYIPNFIFRLNFFFIALNKYVIISLLDIFDNTLMLVSLVASFILALKFFWTSEREAHFYALSGVVWISLTAWISNCLGFIRIPVFVCIQIIVFGSYLYSMYSPSTDESEPSKDENSIHDTLPQETETPKGEFNSMHYIKWLFFICLVVLLISIPSFLYILILMLIIFGLRSLCVKFGIVDVISYHSKTITSQVKAWFLLRSNVLYPIPLRESFSVLSIVKKKVLHIVYESCDSAAAVAVILALLFLAFFLSVFLTLQAYREGVYLIQVGSDIVNKSIIHNPDIHQLLPEDWKTTVETALNDAYIYAREGIAKLVRSALKSRGIDEIKSAEIESSALELWDRAYQAWVMPIQPTVGPTVSPDAVFSSCYNFLERLRKTPEVMSVEWLKELLQENMVLFTSGLDSAWAILKGNLTLLLGILSTLFSLLFGGSLSVINFAIQSIIFLTALYYLLSTSRTVYKPVEVITQISPQYGKKLALAVENSCQEVLAASAKLSIFYALWTWLIHKVFQSNLAYMPAVFAGVLGVVPVFGTYWVCVPAMIDLWFVQESKLSAIGLFIAQLFPTTVVETVIYNEIEGGHPYLTGLSVAGGMFWLGIEGVIAGPLLLCFLFVMLNMFSSQNNEPF